ncbi:hypothetical protein D3C77_473820 [compost metagenome]
MDPANMILMEMGQNECIDFVNLIFPNILRQAASSRVHMAIRITSIHYKAIGTLPVFDSNNRSLAEANIQKINNACHARFLRSTA